MGTQIPRRGSINQDGAAPRLKVNTVKQWNPERVR